jgi:hypothetical protein
VAGDEPPRTPAAEDVGRRIVVLERDVLVRLSGRPSLAHPLRPDPELVRVWGRIKEDLDEIHRLLVARDSHRPGALQQLDALLGTAPEPSQPWALDFAREFGHSLRALVPLFGDAAYLQAALGAKSTRKRFGRVLGDRRLAEATDLLDAEPSALDVARVADELRLIRLDSAGDRRRSHARLALRSRQLTRTLLLMAPLVVATAAAIAVADETTAWHITVAILTGALASVLSGFFTLRDSLSRLRDLRAFRAALFLQPFVGAAAGLFAFLLVDTGVLHLPPADAEPTIGAFALYGFLAGFSEPFLLRTVKRLTGEPDETSASGGAADSS